MSDSEDMQGKPPAWDESFPRPSWTPELGGVEAPLTAGAQIGRFQIERPLGRGGMGVVYLALDTELKRLVALKSLPPEVRTNAGIRSRLQREAQLLAQLNHPNIAGIHDRLEEAKGVTYLVLEYVPGRTLAERMSETRLCLDETLSIATQIATGLAVAHEQGIMHRDLKPGNIMLTPKNEVKILDFGLAKSIDVEAPSASNAVTKPGWLIGTIAYMSPELAMGKPADYRTDMWSLGAVIYEMVSGQLPFAGETGPAAIHAIVYDEPRSLSQLCSGIPVALERLARKMLEKEPRDRYENMWQAVNELKSLSRDCAGQRRRQEESASIAVLPFVDMSPARDREYFCDGIAEELINALAQIKGLRVIARTSAFFYKGRNLNIRQIGRELDVATILEGSVRWAGEQLRVTAQLIDARHDRHLWSERYDRPAGDVFYIQDEIASAIVAQLIPTLLEQEKNTLAIRRPADLEAYHLYLKGCYFRSKGTPGSLQRGLDYLQQAIAKDPEYALAYAALALSYSLLPFYSPSAPTQVVAMARNMVSRALEIDPLLAEGHGSLGFIKTWYDWDWDGAEREIKRAIELSPGCDRHYLWYSYYLMLQCRYEAACKEIRHALELDPVSVVLNRDLGMVFYFAREYDQAIEALERTIEMDSPIMYAHAHLAAAYLGKSMYAEALSEIEKERALAGESHTWADTLEGIARTQMGQTEEARTVLDRLLKRSQQGYVSPFHLACLCFELGEDDAGFEWLNTAYEGQDHWLCFLRAMPTFDRISTDSRCVELLEKVNRPRQRHP